MPITTIAALMFAYCIFIMPFTESAQRRAKNPFDNTNMYMYTGSMLFFIISFALGI